MLNLTQLEDQLRRHLGVDVDDPQWGTDSLDLLLNRTYWEMLDKFKFRQREASGTFVTVVGTRYYDLPTSFDYLIGLFIVDSSGQHIPLDRRSPREAEELYNESTSAEDFPKYYTREGCGIKLIPTPNDVYTIVIKYTITLADLSVSNPQTTIPDVWHECLVFGAAWRGFLELGDYPRYQQMLALYNAKVSEIMPTEGNEEEDSRYAGAECIRPSYNLK